MATFSAAFCVCFCVVYLVLLGTGTPVFYYYPLDGKWSLGALEGEFGPAVTWYGVLLVAFAAASAGGALAALLRLPVQRAGAIAWVPWLALCGCAWFMRGFFAGGAA